MDAKGRTTLRAAGFAYANVDIGLRSRRAHSSVEIHHSPGVPIIDRSSVNAFDDPNVAQAIAATGRKKLIFAGISLEVCAAFPAITAVSKGLDAYVAVDASGTFSETKRQAGLLRMLQAGVIVSDYASLMVEILKDNARLEAGAVYGAMDMPWAKLVGQIAHAYGK
jgi:hypothetical protein